MSHMEQAYGFTPKHRVPECYALMNKNFQYVQHPIALSVTMPKLEFVAVKHMFPNCFANMFCHEL